MADSAQFQTQINDHSQTLLHPALKPHSRISFKLCVI